MLDLSLLTYPAILAGMMMVIAADVLSNLVGFTLCGNGPTFYRSACTAEFGLYNFYYPSIAVPAILALIGLSLSISYCLIDCNYGVSFS
jgi:hypothetical protein